MGVVNTTPDSFYDGGRLKTARQAVDHAMRLIDEGAKIIDIGGESTRPGARPVSAAGELRRVIPVIEGLRKRDSQVAVSIDTLKSKVASEAIQAGADIVNDVSALSADPQMAAICAKAGCHVVLMHRRGTSPDMYRLARYRDVSREVARELDAFIKQARQAGIKIGRIILDPGIGFAKRAPDSWRLLLNLKPVMELGYPVLCGWSRKSFLKEITGDEPDARLAGTLALIGPVIRQGVSILRVHDAAATRATLNTLQALEKSGFS